MNPRVLALLLLAPVLVAGVFAAVPGGASPEYTENKGEYPPPSPGTVKVEAGNVTLANITTNQSTYHWAGVFGNATGKLILGDASGYKLYEWVAKAVYVYFDNDNFINWSATATSATCSDVEGEYTFLQGKSDDCSATFTTTRTYNSYSLPWSGITTIAAQTYKFDGATYTPYWYTLALNVDGEVVFVAETEWITSGKTSEYNVAYDGTTMVNYQVILPENGEGGDTATTTYYVWIELV